MPLPAASKAIDAVQIRTEFRRPAVFATALFAAMLAAGCASTSPAPIEDRNFSSPKPPAGGAAGAPVVGAGAPAGTTAPALPPRAPLDPTLQTYTVQRGDTLFRIALDSGQAWRDVAAWNSLDDPNKLEVGQVLRIKPPEGVAQSLPVKPAGMTDTKPAAAPPPGTVGGVVVAPGPVAAAPATSGGAMPKSEDELLFAWPAKGPVLEPFSETKNKGIDIAGKAGDPVFAAADGTVVYARYELRGYGNLVIIKHNSTYLTAYAHNQALLVKEQQVVKRGQRIAEMGQSDSDRVKLHFEVRRQGKPVDPTKMLPDKP